MILKNNEIYTYANALVQAFSDQEQKLPIKISFYLQKNKKTLIELAQDIEQSRIDIIRSYGEPDETGENIIVPECNIAAASKEIEDLFNLEQEVNINKIDINGLGDDLLITTAQMEALMFMID